MRIWGMSLLRAKVRRKKNLCKMNKEKLRLKR